MTITLESFDSLRARIRSRHDDLSPHLQRLARLALEDPNYLALQTVAAIATRAGVQPSTLIRFAKALDYDGFTSMQQVFRMRLIEGAPDHREQVFSSRSGNDDGDRLNTCADALIRSLEHLKRTISRVDLARAVNLLDNADFIWVAGLRRSRPIAAYLAYGLMRLERRSALLDFDSGMAAQQVANMRRGDVLIAIAFPEYSPPVVDAVLDAHIRGIPVVSLTDGPGSPLATSADVAFYADAAAAGPFRPISGAIGLVQALIELLGAARMN